MERRERAGLLRLAVLHGRQHVVRRLQLRDRPAGKTCKERFNYASFDCAAGTTNDSPNNTGIQKLPAAIAAEIWYTGAANPQFPEIGGGGAPMGGPVYEFDPELVFFEMDVFWAHVGKHKYPGFEPIDYIKRDPRRFPMLHLKDGKTNTGSANGYDIIEFGEGNQAFLSQLRTRGQHFGLFEQDNASSVAAPPNPLNSLGNARRSYTSIYGLRG